MLRIGDLLIVVDWVKIDGIRIGYLVRLPNTQTYMVMVTTLYKWWHSETTTFHLPIKEMTVTLEDVYKIFRLPIRGTPVMATREMMEKVAV